MQRKACIAIIVAVCFAVLFIIIMTAISLKKLDSKEVGLMYNTVQKDLKTKVYTEGLHAGAPGFQFIIFPNVYTTISYDEFECLNSDGVKILIDVSFQFKANLSKLMDIVYDFQDFDGYKRVLTLSGRAVLHEACSHFNTSQFQAERGNFQTVLSRILRERFLALHAHITDLQVNNIARPSEYEAAIRSKERAKEDIQVAIQERPRLLTEANTTKREAESEADIIIDNAESQARILERRAEEEAKAIRAQYEKEAEAYEGIISSSGLQFTPEGFISYLGVRVISSAQNPVYIGLESPAKTSYNTP